MRFSWPVFLLSLRPLKPEDERITLVCELCQRTKTVDRIDWERNKKEFAIYICNKPVIPISLEDAHAVRDRRCEGTLIERQYRKMKVKCLFGFHEWHHCRCSICGKTRRMEHSWVGCQCGVCGETRDQDHDWSSNCLKCAKCGRVGNKQHTWNGCICRACEKTRDEGHDWRYRPNVSPNRMECRKCHATASEETVIRPW